MIFDTIPVPYSVKSPDQERFETLMPMLMSGVGQDENADMTELFAL